MHRLLTTCMHMDDQWILLLTIQSMLISLTTHKKEIATTRLLISIKTGCNSSTTYSNLWETRLSIMNGETLTITSKKFIWLNLTLTLDKSLELFMSLTKLYLTTAYLTKTLTQVFTSSIKTLTFFSQTPKKEKQLKCS